jgi:predicted branched-subunit amino acid permease
MERATRSDFGAGARAMVPVLAGLVPAGIAVGAAWSAAGLPVAPGLVAAASVYGASAQLVVLELGATGASPLVVAIVTGVASIQLALLGAGLGRWLCGASAPSRWLAALVLVSPAYLVTDAGVADSSSAVTRRRYYLGAGATLWAGWQVAHAAGMVLGAVIPPAAALDFALPLCLLGLVAARLRDPATRTAVLAAAATAAVVRAAPLGTGVVVAVAVGIVAGRRRAARS